MNKRTAFRVHWFSIVRHWQCVFKRTFNIYSLRDSCWRHPVHVVISTWNSPNLIRFLSSPAANRSRHFILISFNPSQNVAFKWPLLTFFFSFVASTPTRALNSTPASAFSLPPSAGKKAILLWWKISSVAAANFRKVNTKSFQCSRKKAKKQSLEHGNSFDKTRARE